MSASQKRVWSSDRSWVGGPGFLKIPAVDVKRGDLIQWRYGDLDSGICHLLVQDVDLLLGGSTIVRGLFRRGEAPPSLDASEHCFGPGSSVFVKPVLQDQVRRLEDAQGRAWQVEALHDPPRLVISREAHWSAVVATLCGAGMVVLIVVGILSGWIQVPE